MVTGRELIELLDYVQQNREKYGTRRANRLEKICYKLLYNKKAIDNNESAGINVGESLEKLETEYEKLKEEMKKGKQ